MPMTHTGTVELRTPRLLLRRFAVEDCGAVHRNWAADPEVQHNYGEPVYETPEAVAGLLGQWIDRYGDGAFYRWAIVLADAGECIGQIAFCRVYDDGVAEVEYCVGRRFRGNGYAAEALRAVLRHTLAAAGFQRIEAFHRAANRASGRVLQKAGMTRVETVRRFALMGRMPEHEVCYALEQEGIGR